jgi:hypothetical protein
LTALQETMSWAGAERPALGGMRNAPPAAAASSQHPRKKRRRPLRSRRKQVIITGELRSRAEFVKLRQGQARQRHPAGIHPGAPWSAMRVRHYSARARALPRAEAVPLLPCLALESCVLFPTSSHVLSGSDRVCGGGGDHAMALGKLYVPRTQSTVERGGGVVILRCRPLRPHAQSTSHLYGICSPSSPVSSPGG